MAWLSGYSKRKKLTLTGGASGAQTSFQLKLTIAYDGDMQSDFDDIRFTQSDGTTLIDAWLEVKTDDTSATVWAEFPTTPANTVEQDYYMYYGNGSAVSDWDGPATFLFFDDTEARSNGDLLTAHGWTQDAGTGGKYSTTRPKYGNIGIELGSSDVEQRYHKTPNIALPYTFEYWTYSTTPDTSTIIDSWVWVDGFLTAAILDGYNNANWQLYHGGYYTSSTTVTVGWHHVELDVKSDGSGDVYIDGNLLNISFPSATISAGEIGIRKYTNTAKGYFDNILKRKYASGPPTYAFGSEESAPTEGNPFWYYNMLRRRN